MYRSAHDLKGPVSRLLGLCYLGNIDEGKVNLQEYLNKLENTTKEMENMLARLIRVSEIKSHSVVNTEIDIESLTKKIIDQIVPKDVQFIDFYSLNEKHIVSDVFLISTLFESLIQNALDFRNTTKLKHNLLISFEKGVDKEIIRFSNNGIKIDLKFKEQIFEMFFKGTEQSNGVGLGLYIAQIIVVRKLKGKIYLNTENTENTEFVIELPI